MQLYQYLKERFQINNLDFYLKILEKKKKLIANRNPEITKTRVEISEIRNSKNRQKAMKPKVDSLKKIYKINKPLAKLTRKKTENSN